MDTSDLIRRIEKIPGVTTVEQRGDGVWVHGRHLDVETMGRAMLEQGVRLGTISAIPQEENGETTLIYHYIAFESLLVNFKTQSHNGAVSSLAAITRPASWAEREINDLFAVRFPGHPNPVPLIRPMGFAEGMFRAPMCQSRLPPTGPLAAAPVQR